MLVTKSPDWDAPKPQFSMKTNTLRGIILTPTPLAVFFPMKISRGAEPAIPPGNPHSKLSHPINSNLYRLAAKIQLKHTASVSRHTTEQLKGFLNFDDGRGSKF